MQKRIITFLLILTIVFLLPKPSPVSAFPPIPSSFYGTVKVGGEDVEAGTIVSAWIDGVQYASEAVILDGGVSYYALNVPGDDESTGDVIEGGTQGDTIVFKINGQEADQTGTWTSGTNVNLALTAPVPTPTITVSTTSLGAFNTVVGTPSTTQTYTVSGSNLSGNITIAALTGFEYSSDGTTFTPSLSLPQTGGTVAETTIYVRLSGINLGTFSGNIAHGSTGATTKNVSVNGTVTEVTTPIITVSTNALASFSTVVGSPSGPQTYTVSGNNLTGNIFIGAVSGYEYSLDGIAYSATLSLSQSGGVVAETTIYVRLTGASVGSFNGEITHSSAGAATKYVSIAGTVTATATPTITVSAISLDPFSTVVGTPSDPQTYVVSGNNLLGDIIIGPLSGYEYSLDGTTYNPSLRVPHVSGSVDGRVISVRLIGAVMGDYAGDIPHNSESAPTVNVSVEGTVGENPVPTITISTTSLQSFSTVVGTPSVAHAYLVSGSGLVDDIYITPVWGFEYSVDGINFSINLTLIPEEGVVAPTIIYVRLTGTQVGTYSGNIFHTSTDAEHQILAVTGTVYSDEDTFWFYDVPDTHWASDWIYRLHASGITTGCSLEPPLYCPEESVTRAQMAAFLERGLNLETPGYVPPEGTGTVFTDVPLTYWAVDWIEQLYADEITVGCDTSPLRYCPEQFVTRAEMAVFLLRVRHEAGYTPPDVTNSGFLDVPSTHWAADWIAQLKFEGITTGLPGNLYNPEGFVTRAEMAAFLVRTFELP